MLQRVQRVLAAAGIASRRACEAIVASGRVTVDGAVVTDLAAKVDAEAADIRLDGVPIRPDAPRVTIALHKPAGYVTTVRDPHAGRTVMDLVRDAGVRLYPVGRLDVDTSGLLLMTNDGDFAQRIAHPSHGVEKTYRATVRREITAAAEVRLQTGVRLKDGRTAPAKLRVLGRGARPGEMSVEITIHEGRNHQVRRMFDAVGCPVLALARISVGPITLRGLEPGQWRSLEPAEVAALLAASTERPAPKVEAPRETSATLSAPQRLDDAEIRAIARELTGRLGRDTAEERQEAAPPKARPTGRPRRGGSRKR